MLIDEATFIDFLRVRADEVNCHLLEGIELLKDFEDCNITKEQYIGRRRLLDKRQDHFVDGLNVAAEALKKREQK